ncbi:hypothetical protein BJ165DRAFT_1459176 [Panaeolus papilionaceus]|nr:hypothetical protein BJ165DRAFT_1459176 [Panaeolus papilionaceus]
MVEVSGMSGLKTAYTLFNDSTLLSGAVLLAVVVLDSTEDQDSTVRQTDMGLHLGTVQEDLVPQEEHLGVEDMEVVAIVATSNVKVPVGMMTVTLSDQDIRILGPILPKIPLCYARYSFWVGFLSRPACPSPVVARWSLVQVFSSSLSYHSLCIIVLVSILSSFLRSSSSVSSRGGREYDRHFCQPGAFW